MIVGADTETGMGTDTGTETETGTDTVRGAGGDTGAGTDTGTDTEIGADFGLDFGLVGMCWSLSLKAFVEFAWAVRRSCRSELPRSIP